MTFEGKRPLWEEALVGPRVSQEAVLRTREAHGARCQALLDQFTGTVICYQLNIAGAVKRFPLAEAAFWEGEHMLRRQLRREGVRLVHCETGADPLGMVGYYVVEHEASEVKRWTFELEERCELGRLFDMDVFSSDGRRYPRFILGLPPRKCFLCGEDAHLCAGRQVHTAEEVWVFSTALMEHYFQNKICAQISALAAKALLYEVAAAPKPGLVDRFHTGAHDDMNYFTFLDSIVALIPYFSGVTRQGMEFDGPLTQLLPALRLAGKEAESAMFAVTGGVNTHKGAIFSLGVICAATGRLCRPGESPSMGEICSACAEICADEAGGGLSLPQGVGRPTRGLEQLQSYGLTGARGEAAGGFVSAQRYGLPALKQALGWGWTLNDAGIYALIKLVGEVFDTNIIGRSSLTRQKRIHRQAHGLLADPALTAGKTLALAEELDREFQRLHISPGGCADLLAVSYFFHFYQEGLEDQRLEEPEDNHQ